MKKQLNVDRIQSELRGGSAFFPGYQGSPSPAPPVAPQPQLSESPFGKFGLRVKGLRGGG
jgi:hypothetical protein